MFIMLLQLWFDFAYRERTIFGAYLVLCYDEFTHLRQGIIDDVYSTRHEENITMTQFRPVTGDLSEPGSTLCGDAMPSAG